MDNDCETDDEQVKAAIKQLHKSLLSAINISKEEDEINTIIIDS